MDCYCVAQSEKPSPPLSMAFFHLSSSSIHLHLFPVRLSNLIPPSWPRHGHCPISAVDGGNGSVETAKPKRRGRPPKPKSTTAVSSTSQKKATRSRKKPEPEKPQESTPAAAAAEEGDEDFDDKADSDYPPLLCCFGAAQKEFVPTVRISEVQMHPDMYSTWKSLQWKPPEFVRAPGGPPLNVAISHVRLGGRAAFMGKVGKDELGNEMVQLMNTEAVQTWAVKIDPAVRTAVSHLRIVFDDGAKMRAEVVKECSEDSLKEEEVEWVVLKEAKIFHFNAEVLTSPSMHSALFKAISLSKKFGGLIFFDPNLPMPLWKSRDETRELIKEAWQQADIIEVSRVELEFLLDEEHYEKKRNYRPQYYSETIDQMKQRRSYYHYTQEEISPLWHDQLKILFVTDGTLRIHYYTPAFDGVVVGTEDVLITPFTCDRTGSGDAVVAAIIRKLTTHPEMLENQDLLERQLRFAVAAGIISQWTIGAVRGFPTESATQNLKEQALYYYSSNHLGLGKVRKDSLNLHEFMKLSRIIGANHGAFKRPTQRALHACLMNEIVNFGASSDGLGHLFYGSVSMQGEGK
ncbi:Fructokinase-like 1, chloroplastic [Asimina triloba]